MNHEVQISDLITPFSEETNSPAPSAAARILDSLRRRIITFDLPPDTVLSRIELAEDYGVSQTPVRDALQRLEAEGLVHIYPQSKTTVSRIDPGKITEALFLRRALEIQVARELAKNPSKECLSRLHIIVSLQETIADKSNEISSFQDLDESFHQTMYSAVGFPNLNKLVRSKSGHLNRLRRLDMWDQNKLRRIIKEHKALIKSFEENNPNKAEEVLRLHLSQTIGRLDLLRKEHMEYFKA